MRTMKIAAVGAGSLLALGMAAPAYADDHNIAELSVLHAVPDTPVDVYVNGDLTLDDFQPGDLAGPLELPEGTYSVAITADDAADDSAPILGPIDLPLEADMSYTAVAHLDADGSPTVTLFTNDISETAAGEGRLTVRHTAAAPAVDVWVDGSVLFDNLSNPDEVMGDVPAATYEAAVSLTGETDVVIGPADVPIEHGVNTIVYAWGSAADGNLDFAVQQVDTASANPSGVAAGTQGLAADNGTATGLIVAMLLGIAAVGATASVVVARR
ncbi:MAG: DUF4397 domain-containing protein [Demequina sp.]